MNLTASLIHVRDYIISQLPTYFSKNNCIVTSTFIPLPQLYRYQLQVFYNGTTSIGGLMGSNLDRIYNIGIAISTNIQTDVVTVTEDQSLELVDLMKVVTQTLHMYYAPQTIFTEPLYMTGESPINLLTVDGEKAGVYVIQSYRACNAWQGYQDLH